MAQAKSAAARKPNPAEVLTEALLNAGAALGLSQAELARVIGMSPASVSRLKKGKLALDPQRKEWQLAALVIRLYRGLDAIAASDENVVRAWMSNENTALGGRPKELIHDVSGLVRTVEYLDAYRARV